jgi:integrase
MTDLKDPGTGPETSTSLTIIEPATGLPVPAMIAGAGDRASLRFIDFFTAHIRNPNTRAAYGIAVRGFFGWLETQGLAELGHIRTHHVSTYTEILTRNYSAPTVKQHLAAIRRLFDWLIVGQVIDQNPAAPVRGPTHIVKKGKTPVLLADEARQLLDSIDVSTSIGLRDRALSRSWSTASPGSPPRCRWTLKTIIRRASAGGSACTKKAASSTRCRRIICWRSISTPM